MPTSSLPQLACDPGVLRPFAVCGMHFVRLRRFVLLVLSFPSLSQLFTDLSLSALVSGLSIWNFTSRRLQFKSVLQQSGGGLNTSRFVRLISLSTIEMAVSIPLGSWAISYIVDNSLQPVLNWDDTHADFSKVYIFDAATLLATPKASSGTSVQRWLPIFAAFLYFCFFGMQEEALTTYWLLMRKVWSWRKGFSKRSNADASVLPLFSLALFSVCSTALLTFPLILSSDSQTTTIASFAFLSSATPSDPSVQPTLASPIARRRISRREDFR